MILKHRDKEILRFEWLEPQGVRIVEVNESELRFLPLEMHGVASAENLWLWLKRRVVPRNRRNIDILMALVGLEPKNVRGIVGFCRGLSLNDVHWVVEDGFKGLWRDHNLYDNPFSKAVALTAFCGEGSPMRHLQWTSSPEFSTNGMLAKCWRRVDGEVMLYKSGADGAANAGYEPYSEYYAAQIAEALGLPHVDYGLAKFRTKLCSTCRLFTSDRYGYIPVGRLVSREAALADARFADIFFFDALIFNTDRHMGNFGYLVDNDTNEIVGPAPIFDNGYGLFSLALYRPGDRNDEFDDLRKFVTRVAPALYSKWLGFPGGVTQGMMERLQRLRGFRFTRNRYYNLPGERLARIEDFLQKRISQIAEYAERSDDLLTIASENGTVNPVGDESLALQIKQNLKADPFMTLDDLAELLNVARRTVVRRVNEMKVSGEVRRVGAPKNGYWEVVK